MKTDLKPCPFCGCKKYLVFRSSSDAIDDGMQPSITCKKCDYTIKGAFFRLLNDDDLYRSIDMSDSVLIDWWNKRASKRNSSKSSGK